MLELAMASPALFNLKISQTCTKSECSIRKNLFDGVLAINLLKHNIQFSSVNKISSAILKLIEPNKEIVMGLIKKYPVIIAELREPYFGSCYDNKQAITPTEVVEKICSILSDKNADIRNATTNENVYHIMRGGRSNWRIENNTFNTLKNQNYHLLVRKCCPQLTIKIFYRSIILLPTFACFVLIKLKIKIFAECAMQNDLYQKTIFACFKI